MSKACTLHTKRSEMIYSVRNFFPVPFPRSCLHNVNTYHQLRGSELSLILYLHHDQMWELMIPCCKKKVRVLIL